MHQKQTEPCKAVIAIGSHNTCIILFAYGSMLEQQVSELSCFPDEIGFEYDNGLGKGIHVWEGRGVYQPDDDGEGEDYYFDCFFVREPNAEELAAILRNKSPWPEVWPKQVPVGERILEGLQNFSEKLESGQPIETTQVWRIDGPDGTKWRCVCSNGDVRLFLPDEQSVNSEWDRSKQTYWICRRGDPWTVRDFKSNHYVCDISPFVGGDIQLTQEICFAENDEEAKRLAIKAQEQ